MNKPWYLLLIVFLSIFSNGHNNGAWAQEGADDPEMQPDTVSNPPEPNPPEPMEEDQPFDGGSEEEE